MSEQRIVSTAGSSNSVVTFDERGVPTQPSESLLEYLQRLNLTFVDRDGSEHSLPTESHRGAVIMPTKEWDELAPHEKEAERKRWGGVFPPQEWDERKP